MPKQQRTEVAPPLESDAGFQDLTSVIQANLTDLFQLAHDHPLTLTVPASNEGNIGDIKLVNLSGTYYIYAKVSTTSWLRTVLA